MNGKLALTVVALLALLTGASFASERRDALTGRPELPPIQPLFDHPVRDTCVCVGPKGWYYLTGTTGHPAWWHTNDGIRVWKSKDLEKWQPLGLVWSIEKHGTWQKPYKQRGDKRLRAVWAPEIHYVKGTFWLAYCMNYRGTGLLRSVSGRAEGPYEDIKPDGPLTGEIDASLFADDDGKVYFVYQNGKIARMKDDMSGLAEPPRLLRPANHGQVGFEGAFLTKIDGRYHLVCADFIDIGGYKAYHCMIATAKHVYGPYGDRYLAIPHGGHNMLFRDNKGRWWSTFFGNDPGAPFRERPAILRITFDKCGKIRPLMPTINTLLPDSREEPKSWRYTTVKPTGDWTAPGFDDSGWQRGVGGFGKPGTPGAIVRTPWTRPGIWLRRVFHLPSIPSSRLYLQVHHDEDAQVFINGKLIAQLKGYTTAYRAMPLDGRAKSAMRSGHNLVAVHCSQTDGGQYIDVGLVEVQEKDP